MAHPGQSCKKETSVNNRALDLPDLSKMLVYMFVIISSTSVLSINIPYPSDDFIKCCDVDSAFLRDNHSYSCNKSADTRIFIQTNLNNYSENQRQNCVETLNLSLYLFNVVDDDLVIGNDISDRIFPKCCPRGYSYSFDYRSCVHNATNIFHDIKYIKVGLPTCKIIYDYEFVNEDEFEVSNDYIYFTKLGEKVYNGEYCVDETILGTFVVRVCKSYDFCKEVQCIHKCCTDGKSFVNGSHCEDTYVNGIDVKRLRKLYGNYSDNFAIIHGYKTGVYIPQDKKFHLDLQGNFHTQGEKIGKNVYSFDEETYCIEHATKNGIVYGHTLFRIIPQVALGKKFVFNRWAMFISCIFLVLTIIYYLISSQRSKVFGKILISFCVALLTLFIILIYNTFKRNFSKVDLCKAIGFLLIYFGFSCFVWLQVMCYDIYWTFGSTKRFASRNEKKRRDLKRFIYYSLYGWGLPLMLTLIPLIFHFVDVLPTAISVKVAESRCLIQKGEGNYAEILFYISPLAIMQLANVVFFVKTVKYCLRVKGDIEKMNDSCDLQKKKNKFRAHKERFGLITKLSVIMGIFFLFEVVSSFYDFKRNRVTEHIEIVWDFINCLQGLFIFIIFICKLKYFKKCRSRVSVDKLRKISLSSNSTKITGVSLERKTVQENRRRCCRGDEGEIVEENWE